MNAFPKELTLDFNLVSEIILNQKTYSNVKGAWTDYGDTYILNNGESVFIPYHIYNIEISESCFADLSPTQKNICHCLYSRSCNGFVREKHIGALLSGRLSYWAFPYILKISDEYVVEILDCVYNALNAADTCELKRFCGLNLKGFNKSYSRMVSYWSAYYRRKYPDRKNYVGEKLFSECFGYSKGLFK